MIGNAQTSIPPQQLWRQKFPAVISGVLSFLQLVITIAIIGCEIGSMLVSIVTGTIYVGLWASLFFMIAWISQAASSCCCRQRGCASYTLVIQCISMAFAACVIGFDTYFLIAPTTCFWPSSVCNNSASAFSLWYSPTNFYNIKIPLIKGQLAAGAVMFTLCLVYIILYVVTHIRVQRAKQPATIHPQMPTNYLPAPPVATYAQPMAYPPSQPTATNNERRGTELICPTCSTVMHMAAVKRLPM